MAVTLATPLSASVAFAVTVIFFDALRTSTLTGVNVNAVMTGGVYVGKQSATARGASPSAPTAPTAPAAARPPPAITMVRAVVTLARRTGVRHDSPRWLLVDTSVLLGSTTRWSGERWPPVLGDHLQATARPLGPTSAVRARRAHSTSTTIDGVLAHPAACSSGADS